MKKYIGAIMMALTILALSGVAVWALNGHPVIYIISVNLTFILFSIYIILAPDDGGYC